MSKTTNKLSHTALRSPKTGRHWDGHGLYLEVTERGGRYWRLKYRFGGKEKLLALGVYPEVSLAEARQRRDDARALLRDGREPTVEKRERRAEQAASDRGTFEVVCADWLAFKAKDWSAESQRKAEYVTRTYLLPKLRHAPIATLASKDVIPVLRDLAEKAPDLARKARQYLQGIVEQAIREGLREDGKLLVLDGALPKADKAHIPAETMPEDIGRLMQAIRAYPTAVTRAALLMCAYTAQRPGMVAEMRWADIALESREWRIPAAKMKTRHAHIVPLPKQAIALLDEMRAYSAKREYVFPPLARQKTEHLHRDALSNALRRMGYSGKHAPHGFRGMFRTAARERLGIDADILESQLAHAKKGDVQKAYDRTSFGAERKKAMQKWADWVDQLVNPGRPRRRKKIQENTP